MKFTTLFSVLSLALVAFAAPLPEASAVSPTPTPTTSEEGLFFGKPTETMTFGGFTTPVMTLGPISTPAVTIYTTITAYRTVVQNISNQPITYTVPFVYTQPVDVYPARFRLVKYEAHPLVAEA